MPEEVLGDVIHLLPDSVANQIAAGEVIQRPASVVKELVENSVDAGAQNIEIVIKDAGKTLIQVVDDGRGMSPTDARMAFERHATSKIRCADDLFSLHTMGFRGEALPSVAAVSELEISSRRSCDELATKLVIRASNVESQEPAMAAKGTNIKVKNLFYNFVARRRFLKKDRVELSHIVHEFERLALVNTDVSFKFTSNGALLHSLPRGPLKERITSLFGKSIGDNLIPINTETSLVSISGFVSLPAAARQRAQRQFLFVNGRNMRHPYFHKAILTCFENLIPKDCQPHYFINFTVAPDRIDVNIHPQKHEIKFEDEQSIWQILTASIREALGRYNASNGIDFNNFGAPDIPPLIEKGPISDLTSLTAGSVDSYNPFELKSDNESSQKRFDFGHDEINPSCGLASRASKMNSGSTGYVANKNTSIPGWEELYYLAHKEAKNAHEQEEQSTVPDLSIPDLEEGIGSAPVQFRNKYIVTETPEGILFIDMHRAHVAILFDLFSNEVRSGNVPSQQLMFSEELDLDAQEKVMLDSSIEMIERIGFRIGRSETGNYTLEGIPGSLGSDNPARVLRNILDDLAESGIDVEADALKRVLLTMARSAAMTAGRALTQPEMEHLVSSLFRLTSPTYTPDGLRIIFRLTDEKLNSFFA